MSAKIIVQKGPDITWVRSSTRMPFRAPACSGPLSVVITLLSRGVAAALDRRVRVPRGARPRGGSTQGRVRLGEEGVHRFLHRLASERGFVVVAQERLLEGRVEARGEGLHGSLLDDLLVERQLLLLQLGQRGVVQLLLQHLGVGGGSVVRREGLSRGAVVGEEVDERGAG